jgi:hypothetical protein
MKFSKEQRANWTKEQKRYYKQHGIFLENPSEKNTIDNIVYNKSLQHNNQYTVLCVRFGHKYSREYVERLRNMVSRNLTVPYEFACLTDDNTPMEGVRTIYQPSSGYSKPWWHKVHMFDSKIDLNGRILYFDLDVIIHNNIDKLFTDFENQFLGIRDFNRKFHSSWKYLNSSVMSWTHGTLNHIYTEFKRDTGSAMRLHGDQDWIWKLSKDTMVFWPEPWIQSYKWEIRSRDELVERTGKRGFKYPSNEYPNKDCSVTVFHGDPKPQDIKDKYVVDQWR